MAMMEAEVDGFGGEVLDGDVLVRWGRRCFDELDRHRGEIDDLNVFPVPDADTGTNLCATLRAAVQRVADDVGPDAGAHEVVMALVRGATDGARGNSGTIVSQLLRGFAEAAQSGPLTAAGLTRALRRAADLARGAMSEPVEGTIVTVLDAAARAAACDKTDSPARVAVVAADAAADAVRCTTGQLAALRDAGVVDAGGRGVSVMLDALVTVTTGRTPQRAPFAGIGWGVAGGKADAEHGGIGRRREVMYHEVMYLVDDIDSTRADRLRARLAGIGRSVIVAGGGTGTWRVHVHCRDVGAAVDAGLEAGRVRHVRVGCFMIGSAPGSVSTEAPDRGILALAAGDGAVKLFEAAGATVLRCDNSVAAVDLLRAIRAMTHREVMILANGALSTHELIAVGVSARGPGRDVLLVPSASIVQGLAALAVHDPGRTAVDDAFAMSEAVAATRWGALRMATEQALTSMGMCRPGDGIGLAGHEVVVIEPDVGSAAVQLVDRFLGVGGELVTLLVGAGAPETSAGLVRDHIVDKYPGVEVSVYSGGQHSDLLQLGVE